MTKQISVLSILDVKERYLAKIDKEIEAVYEGMNKFPNNSANWAKSDDMARLSQLHSQKKGIITCFAYAMNEITPNDI